MSSATVIAQISETIGSLSSGISSISINVLVSSRPIGFRSLIVFVADSVVVAEELFDLSTHRRVVHARMPGEQALQVIRAYASAAPSRNRAQLGGGHAVAGDRDGLATLDRVHHRRALIAELSLCNGTTHKSSVARPQGPCYAFLECATQRLPPAQLPVLRDEAVGGRVVGVGGRSAVRGQFRLDLLGEDLAELDAPLVERVDVPDRALREDLVLVQGDELAEHGRGQPGGDDRGGRVVALEDAVRDDRGRGALGLDLVLRLAEGERFGLREEVRG